MREYSCEDTRVWRDALADGQPPADAASALEQHLAQCESCRAEVTGSRALRSRLRQAASTVSAPPGLETRIRASLRPRPVWAAPWAQFAGAALGLVLLTAGGWAVALRPFQNQIAAVLGAGRGSHVHCTLERKNPPQGSLQRPLPERHRGLPAAAASVLPAGFQFSESHLCRNEGRVFTHVVYIRGTERLSVIVTDKRPGESLPMPALLSKMRASGIPVYTSTAAGLQTAAIETPRGWGYVVSNTDSSENLKAMALLAASIVQADR